MLTDKVADSGYAENGVQSQRRKQRHQIPSTRSSTGSEPGKLFLSAVFVLADCVTYICPPRLLHLLFGIALYRWPQLKIGKVQKIGKRGMRAVLEGRRLTKKGEKMNADAMATLLSNQPDFLEERPEVEIDTQDRGHYVLWNPKFHAELNPIEMKWAAMKDYTRKHTKESMAATKKGVAEALQHYTYKTGEKHCAHARRYMRAYMSGTPSSAVEAEMMAKAYTGHRTGGEGAVKIVLANSQQPITQEEADSIHYIRNREQWRRHKQGIQGRTDKLLQSKIRRLQQSHGLPAHAKDSKL